MIDNLLTGLIAAIATAFLLTAFLLLTICDHVIKLFKNIYQ